MRRRGKDAIIAGGVGDGASYDFADFDAAGLVDEEHSMSAAEDTRLVAAVG